jgi:hypothetical protein
VELVHVGIGVRGSEICGASELQPCMCRFPDREIPDGRGSIDPLTHWGSGF